MLRTFVVRCLALLVLAVTASNAARSAVPETPPRGLRLIQGFTSLPPGADGEPNPTNTFYANEDVDYYAKVGWNPGQGSGGPHRLQYKWYENDALLLTFGSTKSFDTNPTYWWAYVHASHFSPGHHKIELYIDDKLVASENFEIELGPRAYEPPEDTLVKETGRAMLLKGDTRGFDELANHYRESQERTASGTWKLSLLYRAIDRGAFPPRDTRWQSLHDMADAWLTRQPQSVTAVILDAQLLNAHAGTLRGQGVAAEVPETTWAPYRALLERTRSLLEQHADIARLDPEWYALRISVARQQGTDSDAILALARRALDQAPYYYPIHNNAVNALMPRWGGSRAAVEEYVRMALEHSRPREGTAAYARIYYYVARSTAYWALDDLNQMGAKWPPMKQSLVELRRAYPSAFNQDISRAITCMAGDAGVYRALGRAETDQIASVAFWDTREARRRCNEWAFEGKLAALSLSDRVRGYVSFLQGFGPAFWMRVRIAALIAVILVEGGLRLVDWLWRSRASVWGSSPRTTPMFNPMDYPRTYLVSPISNPLLARLSVWMVLLGAAVAYTLTTIPWANPVETGIVMAVCVAVALAGVLMILFRLTSRVVLTGDGISLHAPLLAGRTLHRHEILAVHQYLAGKSRIIELLLHAPNAKPVRVPAVRGEDEAFRNWFASLPAAGVPPSTARGARLDGSPESRHERQLSS
jgi:hypothetical protein